MLVEERVNIQALHDMLIADQQDAFFEKKLRYTAPLIMQSLIKRGYFKDEYIVMTRRTSSQEQGKTGYTNSIFITVDIITKNAID